MHPKKTGNLTISMDVVIINKYYFLFSIVTNFSLPETNVLVSNGWILKSGASIDDNFN